MTLHAVTFAPLTALGAVGVFDVSWRRVVTLAGDAIPVVIQIHVTGKINKA